MFYLFLEKGSLNERKIKEWERRAVKEREYYNLQLHRFLFFFHHHNHKLPIQSTLFNYFPFYSSRPPPVELTVTVGYSRWLAVTVYYNSPPFCFFSFHLLLSLFIFIIIFFFFIPF